MSSTLQTLVLNTTNAILSNLTAAATNITAIPIGNNITTTTATTTPASPPPHIHLHTTVAAAAAATTAHDLHLDHTQAAHDHLHHHNQHQQLDQLQLEQQQQQQQHLFQSILSDQVTQTKLLASLVLFVITLLCGYLPVRCILNQSYIQYAMFAGGGVLMATAFCHLIPETHDSYRQLMGPLGHTHAHHHHHHNDQHQHNQNGTEVVADHGLSDAGGGADIPYPEVTLCCGFFFMYLVEQLMIRFINNHTHDHPCDTSMGQLVPPSSQTNGRFGSGSSSAPIGSSSANLADLGGGGGVGQPSIVTAKGTEFYKFIRGLLIVSAFMAHSIFDGVAIGSQVTIGKVWTIFLAISCHKLIIAAVVGLELYAATLESHLWTLVHLFIFSIMSPIGIILVVVAQNSLNMDANHPAMIMLQSFATGTLLYIVFVEILQPKEGQAYEKNRIGKSISLIGGFALMLLVLTLIGDHH